MPPVSSFTPPLTWVELQSAAPGAEVSVALAVTDLPAPDLLAGTLLEADEAEPFSAYRRTAHPLRVRWTPAAQFVMGDSTDLRPGALIRVRGDFHDGPLIEAQRLVILTSVARLVGD
jgi:hypothetical protein